jgi:hypothetical protein
MKTLFRRSCGEPQTCDVRAVYSVAVTCYELYNLAGTHFRGIRGKRDRRACNGIRRMTLELYNVQRCPRVKKRRKRLYRWRGRLWVGLRTGRWRGCCLDVAAVQLPC